MDTETLLTGVLVLVVWLAVDILVGSLVGLLLATDTGGLTAPATRRATHADISTAG